MDVNKGGASLVAIACEQHRAKMVHFSTWAVFGGEHDKPNNERTRVNPINAYGKTKLAGEKSVLEKSKDSLVIRSGWVFGEEEGILGQWMDSADRNMRVQVRKDKVISPTYVNDLVDAAIDLASKKIKGIYHVANDGPVTMEEFARAVLGTSGIDDNLVEALDDSKFKSQFPRNSALLCNKYRRVMRDSMRSWRDSLKECLFNMNRYSP
jgi:dTDP-4-dehydrorhamnose reductase